MARAAWLILLTLCLTVFAFGIRAHVVELREVCDAEECDVLAISDEEAEALADIGLNMDFYAWYQASFQVFLAAVVTAIAGVIFWRRSDDWMALLVSVTLFLFGVVLIPAGVTALARLYPALQGPIELLVLLSVIVLLLLFYLFPNGRLVPRWTPMFMAVMAAAAVLALVIPGSRPIGSGVFNETFWVIVLLSMGVGVAAQIYRYVRVSSATQRQQTKWVVLGLAAAVVAMLTWSVLAEFSQLEPGRARLLFNTFGLGGLILVLTFFPTSLGISILQYRLWDIDVLINRTLVYGGLTATLAVTYFGAVVLLQAAFRGVTGQESNVALVASTLGIAALFQPLRGRLQRLIDRRFYRRRYNASRMLGTLSMTLRDEVDLDKLSGALVQVVEETMQPAHVTLWLREPVGPLTEGRDSQRR